jgi:hypothetical protein
MTTTKRLMAGALALALAGGSLLGCRNPQPPTSTTTTTGDPGNPTTTVDPGPGGGTVHGPAPTDALLTAARGPFPITSTNVARGNGFGGGTLHYPTDASLGRLGTIVVVPGFLSAESSIAWYGPRLASHGFVVLTIATNATTDVPQARSTQQRAAFTYLRTSSPAASRVDPARLAAAGWSMGGGGSLISAGADPNIKVVLPLAAWNPGSRYTYNKPAFLVSCSNDSIAGNSSNSDVFYNSLSGEKAQLTISDSHFCVTTSNNLVGKLMVSWLKVFLDGDARYKSFACPSGTPSGATAFRSTCPV